MADVGCLRVARERARASVRVQRREVVAHVVVQRLMVAFEREHVVGASGADPCGDLRLRAHRVDRHDAAAYVEHVEQCRNRRDLVRFGTDGLLREHEPLP